MYILSQVWNYVIPIGSGLTIGAILITIGTIAIKSIATKLASKINIEKIESSAVDKGIDKLKSITIKQDIQPILESGLKKVNEKSIELIDEHLTKMETEYACMLEVLTKLSAFFDSSIAISESTKEELRVAIANAKENYVAPTIVESKVEVVAEDKKEDTKKTNIER